MSINSVICNSRHRNPLRDSKGISQLPKIQLTLPYKMSRIRNSSEIQLLSLYPLQLLQLYPPYLKVLYPVVPETVKISSLSIPDKEDPSDDTFLRRLCC